jgi:hypothetical protein
MSDDPLKVDADYKQHFNQGYELASELGLKSDILKDISAGNHRMAAMSDGMKQYERELAKSKELGKDRLPPMDLDSLDSRTIDLRDTRETDKDKGKDIDI